MIPVCENCDDLTTRMASQAFVRVPQSAASLVTPRCGFYGSSVGGKNRLWQGQRIKSAEIRRDWQARTKCGKLLWMC
jgi:hypothetical protein